MVRQVALQSGMQLQLLDCGTSVPSMSEPDPANNNGFLATLRVQGSSNRVQVQIMTEEGAYGTLSAFVVTRVAPKVPPPCSQLSSSSTPSLPPHSAARSRSHPHRPRVAVIADVAVRE
jgi:hypothetical protein